MEGHGREASCHVAVSTGQNVYGVGLGLGFGKSKR